MISDFFRDTGVAKEEIKLWAIYPGGRAILDKLGKSLRLEYDDISEAYGILKDYGNMSSATIMFLLERMMENDKYEKMCSAHSRSGSPLKQAS